MPRKRESYPPSAVQKECQRVIHFIAHNKVFKMEDLTDELKRNKMLKAIRSHSHILCSLGRVLAHLPS
jgi:exopolysaccharide biosynthesis predicted pyruvyltransferase EpsI